MLHRGKLTTVKPRVSVDDAEAKRQWQKLQASIDQIYHQNASALSFEELYRYSYHLVLHQHGDMLYNGVRDTIRAQLDQVATGVAAADDESLLAALQNAWVMHRRVLPKIRDILMYMDRVYVKDSKETVEVMGLRLFKDVVVRHPDVRVRMQEKLLQCVQKDREGEVIDKGQVHSILAMLVELGINSTSVYKDDFELEFMHRTEQFYKDEAAELIAHCTCAEYLAKAEDRIDEERRRVHEFLHQSTAVPLRDKLFELLVVNHAQALVNMPNSGLIAMLNDDKAQDLGRMYRLFSQSPSALQLMRTNLHQHVLGEGKRLVTDPEQLQAPVQLVQKLLKMRHKYAELVSHAFAADKQFHADMKSSFEDFLNIDPRVAQFVALYIDDLLRHSLRGVADEEADAQLDGVVALFRFLQDKDIFEASYKSFLQKRLLGDKSLSDELEKSMITKLKTECGCQFTSKLEGMFQDIRVSRDLTHRFTSEVPRKAADIDFTVTVLTTGTWPAQPVEKCPLPAAVAGLAKSFQDFYLSKHSGRVLTWQCNRGSADMRATFDNNKRHELSVSTYQMCILLLFNARTSWTYAQIKEETQIPDEELKRHLISLCTPRSPILRRVDKSKNIEPEHEFQYNNKFTSKFVRVKVALVSSKTVAPEGGEGAEGGPDIEPIPENIEADRRHLIESVIIRVMKTRQSLHASVLTSEVTNLLATRFRPSPADIKSRIESLIEREYLERSQDRRLLKYLA